MHSLQKPVDLGLPGLQKPIDIKNDLSEIRLFTTAYALLTHLQVSDWQEEAVLLLFMGKRSTGHNLKKKKHLRNNLIWHLNIYYVIMLAPLLCEKQEVHFFHCPLAAPTGVPSGCSISVFRILNAIATNWLRMLLKVNQVWGCSEWRLGASLLRSSCRNVQITRKINDLKQRLSAGRGRQGDLCHFIPVRAQFVSQ